MAFGGPFQPTPGQILWFCVMEEAPAGPPEHAAGAGTVCECWAAEPPPAPSVPSSLPPAPA